MVRSTFNHNFFCSYRIINIDIFLSDICFHLKYWTKHQKSTPTPSIFQIFFSPSTLSLPNLLHSFRHENFKKFPEDTACFNIFTTAACNFSTLAAACNFRAIFDLSADHLTPHPPLSQAYFSTDPTHESLKKTQHFVTSLTFMCFSPQRRAIFRHQNGKMWSETVCFLTFSRPNVLFATAACNFSTSAVTKVLSECGVLYIFTSECAFHHSGVQFFDIWTSKSAPRPSAF